MPQIIEIPGVGEVEFPDGMSDDAIKAAAKKLARPQMVASHMPATGTPPPVSESAARGGFQGLSMGFGDELAGGLAAALPFTDPEAAQGATLAERYRNARDFYRARNQSAQEANPGTYLTGQVAGAVVPSLVGAAPAAAGAKAATSGTKALLRAAGQGAVQGAGYSDADSVRGLASDTALGAGLGVAGHGIGTVVGKGISYVGGKAHNLADLARARAGVQAAGEVSEEIGSAAGKLGAETQKGSRYIENLMRLEESMTPEQRALYSELQASGVVPNLQRSVAQGTLESLPGQAGTIAAKREALAALQENATAAVQERTKTLLTPQVKADAKSFVKAYAEPLAWAYGANKVAEALGADPETRVIAAGAAGLIGGRTRAGKALKARLTRPAHQLAIAQGVTKTADVTEPLVRAMLQAGIPATAIPALIGEDQTP